MAQAGEQLGDGPKHHTGNAEHRCQQNPFPAPPETLFGTQAKVQRQQQGQDHQPGQKGGQKSLAFGNGGVETENGNLPRQGKRVAGQPAFPKGQLAGGDLPGK